MSRGGSSTVSSSLSSDVYSGFTLTVGQAFVACLSRTELVSVLLEVLVLLEVVLLEVVVLLKVAASLAVSSLSLLEEVLSALRRKNENRWGGPARTAVLRSLVSAVRKVLAYACGYLLDMNPGPVMEPWVNLHRCVLRSRVDITPRAWRGCGARGSDGDDMLRRRG